MKAIPLTQGKFALVDDEDYEQLMQWKWHALRTKSGKYYAQRTVRKPGNKFEYVYMHLQIIGRKEGFIVDHKDGDGLDNQRYNLQHVTRRQNSQNKRKQHSSIYTGVYWAQDRKRYKARICVNGRIKYLGDFKDEKDAAKAYLAALAEIGEALNPVLVKV